MNDQKEPENGVVPLSPNLIFSLPAPFTLGDDKLIISILQANKNIKDPNMISIGQSIVIPKKRGVPVYSNLKKSEWGRIKGGTNPYVAEGFSGKKGGTVRRKKGSTVKRNRGGKIVADGNQYVANLYKGGKVGG